jgi:hypothetical protein
MKPASPHPYSPELLTDKKYFWNCRTKAEILEAFNGQSLDQAPLQFPLLAIVEENKKLFRLITSTVETMSGWATKTKACALASLVLARKPQVVVEIGVYAGRSLLPMAMALREIGSGKIIGIDPYSAIESSKNEWGENELWWRNLDHEKIYNEFQSYVRRFDLGAYIELIRKPADKVEAFAAEIAHMDGNHQEGVVSEAERFGAKMPTGGCAVFDDRHWQGGAILRAEGALEDMGFVHCMEVSGDGDDWSVMQKAS